MRRGIFRVFAWSGVFAVTVPACGTSNDPKPAAGQAGAPNAPESGASGGGAQSGSAGKLSTVRAGTSGSSDQVGSAGAAGAATVDEEGCDAMSVGDWEIDLRSSWDPLGYPPYAFYGCNLVYVAAGTEPGALHLRNLVSGEDTVLESAAKAPRRPAVSGPVIAWEADGAEGSEVHVRFNGEVRVMMGAFVRAEEPRVTRDAVVFTGFLGAGPNADSDVYLFDMRSEELSAVATGPGQQRFADVSPTHVAFTDFSDDPKGYFSEAGSTSDIGLIERATGTRSKRSLPGKQAFPVLGSNGVFAYLEWAAVHPEPKLGQFWLKAGSVDRPPSEDFNVKISGQVTTNPAYVRPSLRGSNLDFVDQGAEGVALYRSALSALTAPSTPAPLQIPGALQLYGPVAGERFTLLAGRKSAQRVSLIAVPR